MARLGTPGQPDPRVEGKIELGELIMAFLRFDFDTAGSLEVNHGGCADEFLADHDGFHSVQAGSGLILRQLDTVAGNDKGRRVVPGQVFGGVSHDFEVSGRRGDFDETVRQGGNPSRKDVRRPEKLRDKLCPRRSEEHTSELQSLMRISYAVFCLKKKNKNA